MLVWFNSIGQTQNTNGGISSDIQIIDSLSSKNKEIVMRRSIDQEENKSQLFYTIKIKEIIGFPHFKYKFEMEIKDPYEGWRPIPQETSFKTDLNDDLNSIGVGKVRLYIYFNFDDSCLNRFSQLIMLHSLSAWKSINWRFN